MMRFTLAVLAAVLFSAWGLVATPAIAEEAEQAPTEQTPPVEAAPAEEGATEQAPPAEEGSEESQEESGEEAQPE